MKFTYFMYFLSFVLAKYLTTNQFIRNQHVPFTKFSDTVCFIYLLVKNRVSCCKKKRKLMK